MSQIVQFAIGRDVAGQLTSLRGLGTAQWGIADLEGAINVTVQRLATAGSAKLVHRRACLSYVDRELANQSSAD